METTVSNLSFDKDRVWHCYELPAGARVKVQTKRIVDWKEVIKDDVAIFIYMDWMYWRWKAESDESPLIFSGYFKQIGENEFTFYNEEEWTD